MSEYRVIIGDVAEILPTLEPGSFDACLSDPPYGLGFMGKAWDHSVPSAAIWALVLAVLNPGAHILAFGGTRTFHRLACAIEDAGFEIRDCLSWLYGQGFPKSLDISKAIDKDNGFWRGRAGAVTIAEQPAKGTEYERTPKGDPVTAAAAAWSGYGTALKPAWEPVILAMNPLAGTFAENALKHGVAGLNVDGCRIAGKKPDTTRGAGGQHGVTSPRGAQGRIEDDGLGRWPPNVAMDELAAAMLDAQSGEIKSGALTAEQQENGGFKGAKSCYGTASRGGFLNFEANAGGASRFFYVAKPARAEREAGLCEAGLTSDGYGSIQGDFNPSKVRNIHPTVKPVKLCEWLARLLLPPARSTPRRLLVPFCGSGSEMAGALRSGWDDVVGIEVSAEYAAIAEARLADLCSQRVIGF